MNLADWVQRHGRRRPESPAIAHGMDVHATWAQLAFRTGAIAAGLHLHLGAAPGDRVAIVMRNRPEYLEALLAIWHAGLVAVPINSRLHRAEIEYIVEHSGSIAVVTDDDHAADLEAVLDAVETMRVVVVAQGEQWHDLAGETPIGPVERQSTDPAWLFYTSGTTGRPKRATLTNRNLMAMTLSYYADIDAIAPQDCILHAAPISHGSGLYGLPHIARGALRTHARFDWAMV